MSRIRPFVPAILWMAVIFTFSSSLFGNEGSGALFEPLLRLVYPGASREFVELLHFLFRKAAHFTEYAVLAVLWHRGLAGVPGLDARRAVMTALAVSAAYAASDEFHQSFVPGRTPSALDVLLDSAGAAAACLALWLRRGKARPA
ncbi:MAG: VanZ family protein [Nitrospirae bacterium]|nr:VanZ family protein [Nitrospirota bacterium]MBI5694350.1 VanZ family protein [Nitrospirota bacterium]